MIYKQRWPLSYIHTAETAVKLSAKPLLFVAVLGSKFPCTLLVPKEESGIL